MKLRLLILLTTALCGLCTAAAQPAPEKTTPREGIFTFGPGTTISADRELAPLAEYAAEYLGCGVRNGMAGEGSVVLTLDAPDGEPSEAYTLDIAPPHPDRKFHLRRGFQRTATTVPAAAARSLRPQGDRPGNRHRLRQDRGQAAVRLSGDDARRGADVDRNG